MLGALVFCVGWATAAYVLLRTQVPSGLDLPELDESDFFTAEQVAEAERYDWISRFNWISSSAALLISLTAYARWGHHFTRESAAGRIGTVLPSTCWLSPSTT